MINHNLYDKYIELQIKYYGDDWHKIAEKVMNMSLDEKLKNTKSDDFCVKYWLAHSGSEKVLKELLNDDDEIIVLLAEGELSSIEYTKQEQEELKKFGAIWYDIGKKIKNISDEERLKYIDHPQWMVREKLACYGGIEVLEKLLNDEDIRIKDMVKDRLRVMIFDIDDIDDAKKYNYLLEKIY